MEEDDEFRDIIAVNELIDAFGKTVKERNSSALVVINACLWVIFSASDHMLKFEVQDLKCIFEEALLRYDQILKEPRRGSDI